MNLWGHAVDIVIIIVSLGPFRHLRIYLMLNIEGTTQSGISLDDGLYYEIISPTVLYNGFIMELYNC